MYLKHCSWRQDPSWSSTTNYETQGEGLDLSGFQFLHQEELGYNWMFPMVLLTLSSPESIKIIATGPNFPFDLKFALCVIFHWSTD